MINIERRKEAPLSLARKKSWRSKDVLKALFTDFKEKCYLTERKFGHYKDLEVDHFVLRNEDDTLHYEWTNLYPGHEKANKRRDKQSRLGGYLDPCDSDDDVERDITYVVEIGGKALFKASNPNNQKAVNTADQLSRIHQDLKEAIRLKHHEVVQTVAEWRTAIAIGRTDEAYEKELLLKTLLSRDSQFTTLMRSIRVVKDLPDDFFD
jgi:hypothetical protein